MQENRYNRPGKGAAWAGESILAQIPNNMNKKPQHFAIRLTWNILASLGAGVLVCLGGCGLDAQKAAANADKKTYEILDNQWKSSLGEKPDIRIGEPNDADGRMQAIVSDIRQTKLVTLEQAVRLGLWASEEYRQSKEQLYLAGLNQADMEDIYEITPFAGGIGGYGKEQPNEGLDAQGTAGMQKLLATGAMITTDMTVGYMDVLTGDFRTGTTSIFQAAITQPLLRGSARKVVMENLTQAQQDTLYAIRDFNRFRKTLCVSITTDYCRIAQLGWQCRNARDNVQEMERLYASMQDLSGVGRLAHFEMEQAQQDLIKTKNAYSVIRRQYQEGLDLLKLRLGLPPRLELEVETEAPLLGTRSQSETLFLDENEAIDWALGQRLDLANAFDRTQDAQRHIEVAADALGADLSLVGYAAPASTDSGRMFGADPGDLQRTRDRYELSLRGSLPLDRNAEGNNYKRAMIAMDQQARAHLQLTDQVIADVRKAWRDMAEAKQRHTQEKQSRDLAQGRLENTLMLLHYGRASTRDVLDAQKDLYAAKDAYAEALADYSIAQMAFLRDTETLWILPDGSWQSEKKTQISQRPAENRGTR